MVKILLSMLFLISLNFYGCSRGRTNTLSSDKYADTQVSWKDITQFKSVSLAGNVVWIVTVKGDLVRLQDKDAIWMTEVKNNIGKLEVVSFSDSQHGWIVDKKGQVWQTANGGQTWSVISSLSKDEEHFYLPRQLLFIDESNGWLIDAFTIWHTDNGGKNWKDRFSTRNTDAVWQPYHASFVNPLIGWVSCTSGIIFHTIDGGKTWKMTVIDSNRTAFRDVQFINQQIGWISGLPDGGVYRSDDGGSTWQQQLSEAEGVHIRSIYFVNINEGYAVGWRPNVKDQTQLQAVALHTKDSGKNWSPVQVGENDPFFDQVYFADAQHGWLFSRDNIYSTADGGNNWDIVLQLPPINGKNN